MVIAYRIHKPVPSTHHLGTSAISHGFHTDALKPLAQVYIEHGFLSENEADIFLSEIPVLQETEEVEYTVSDQMLETESSDRGNLVPRPSHTSLDDLVQTFTESQLRAFQWVKDKFESNEQLMAAVVGLAGTGKSYLLKGLIELAKSKNLVVSKLAPSGAAHFSGLARGSKRVICPPPPPPPPFFFLKTYNVDATSRLRSWTS